ncbi:MAG: spore cortex biosynthesis protein YabQ [Angelakisella sp.]
MGISIAEQTAMFLRALLLGGIIGVVYDVFRVTRVAFKLSWSMVLLEDLLFFLLSAILLWRYFLEQGSGEVRIFAVLGVLLGWLLYFLTVGSLVIRASGIIIGVIAKMIAAVMVPLWEICGFIKKYWNKLIKLIISGKNCLKSRLYMLYNNRKRPPR